MNLAQLLWALGLWVAALWWNVPANSASAADLLPNGMVYLADIDPTIIQDIRYATPMNFTGRPVSGYVASECVLTEKTARALKKAQESLGPSFSLKVFDCYRPLRAVSDFIAWARRTDAK